MSKEHHLPSDSDEDDEDYVPDGIDSEPLSEAESEGETESSPEDENDENKRKTGNKGGGKKAKDAKSNARCRKKVSDMKNEENKSAEKLKEKNELTEEEEKKRADSLWADFMKDTAASPKSKAQTTNGPRDKSPTNGKAKTEEKVKITKIFEFAGEAVKVEEEVRIDSAEARLSLSSAAENSAKNSAKSSVTATPENAKEAGRGRGFKRAGLAGISAVLGQIGKKAKISTLEKSKLDWDSYKREENLEEEISTHNKGKDGYLERQDFLQRADLRQFEIEKRLRNISRRSTR